VNTWVLVYMINLVGNTPMNKPIIMDYFTTKEHCEMALEYVDTTYKQLNVKGTGYCWGEKSDG